jgi:hypothetical protein
MAPLILNSIASWKFSGQHPLTTALTPSRKFGPLEQGDWMGPRTRLEVLEKRNIYFPSWDKEPGLSSP